MAQSGVQDVKMNFVIFLLNTFTAKAVMRSPFLHKILAMFWKENQHSAHRLPE